jgi:hypothetical protein
MRAAPRRFAEGGGRRTSQLDQLIAILRGGSTSIVGLIVFHARDLSSRDYASGDDVPDS